MHHSHLLIDLLRRRPELLREPILREDLDASALYNPPKPYIVAIQRWRDLLDAGDADAVIAALESADVPMRTVCPLDVLLLTPCGEL